MSITVPLEMAALVRAKVASGEYASESEVFRDGLRILLARDKAIEQWLEHEVAATYDELKADPAQAIPISAVRDNIRRTSPAAGQKKTLESVPALFATLGQHHTRQRPEFVDAKRQ